MPNRTTEKNVHLDLRLRLRRLEVARARAAREEDVRRVEALDQEIGELRRAIEPPR